MIEISDYIYTDLKQALEKFEYDDNNVLKEKYITLMDLMYKRIESSGSNGFCGLAIYQVFQGIIKDTYNTRLENFDTF